MTLPKFQITVETKTGGRIGHVVRAPSLSEATLRAKRAHPGGRVVGVAQISGEACQ